MAKPGAQDITALKGFYQANKNIRMRRYFYGAGTFEAATTARRAHFDYVQGVGVAPPMPVAGKIFSV